MISQARFPRGLPLMLLAGWCLVACSFPLNAQEVQLDPELQEGGSEISLPNIKTWTLGGKQFWTDHHWRNHWRLQKHAITGHWRLIDKSNVRHAWGSRSACEAVLETRQPNRKLESPQVFVLVHGLMRSANSMRPIEEALMEAFDCQVVAFEYASTRASIQEHAAALREVMEGLPPDVQLGIVGHSMGSILTRFAMHQWQRQDAELLDRLDAFVMLGPPNQGAALARQLSRLQLFEWVTGKSGMQLGPEWETLQSQLAVPSCPFGIIAGSLSKQALNNPLLKESSDFVVTVEETKLAGAADFLVVDKMHTFLMDDQRVQQAVVNFMRHHRFD